MPLHDQSYRHYAGTRVRPGRAWLVIARAGIRAAIGRRRFLALLVVAWIPFLVRAVQIYLAANVPQASVLELSARTFRDFLEQQNLFVLFVAIYAGAGLIAGDRRAHALQVYLSKPLTRTEYVAGKLAILATFLLLVTWVPATLLVVTQVLFSGSLDFVGANPWLLPAITAYAGLQVGLASFTMLALSSLSTSSRFVAVLFAGAVLFSDAIYGVLRLLTGGTRVAWVSFSANLVQIGDVVFGQAPRYDVPWTVSLVVVAGLIVVSVSILERRVRGVEVVT